MPTLDYFFGAINRAILGRPLYAAMHDFRLAGNALLFGTPVEVLRACELIADCFKDFQAGSEEFPKKLEGAKQDFVVVARLTVTGDLHPRQSVRLRRWLKRERPALTLPESIRVAQREHEAPPEARREEHPEAGLTGGGTRGTVQSA